MIFYRKRTNRWSRLVASLLVFQLAAMFLPDMTVLAAPAGPESFADPAFQQQWQATDQDVATGKVSRTYFWGPGPFAHTNEVYAESPDGGVRHIQYFDKARMELTKRDGQDPDLVTNGLLTVELVTGQMQVGDNTFISRSPATNPVAGDQVNNDQAPTYASFYNGKLAFGVTGAIARADRSGQPVNEAVNLAGQVSTLSQTAAPVKYQQFFPQTGHNLADVFNNFFQAAPLGADKWLNVMGYPISEPFWAKDQVVVAGQPRDVLIQLFQRRVLTYTPSNPAGFQVEMGNIGQHYYVWRYGFDPHDQLPGNYRLITVEGRTVYSTSIRDPKDKVKLSTLPGDIVNLFAFNNGWAVAGVLIPNLGEGTFRIDLTQPGEAVDFSTEGAFGATSSPDGTLIAASSAHQLVLYSPDRNSKDVIGGNRIDITNSGAYGGSDLSFSPDNKYLTTSSYIAQPNARIAITQVPPINEWSNTAPSYKKFDLTITADQRPRLNWLNGTANTGKLLVSYPAVTQEDGSKANGKLLLLSASDVSQTTLIDSPNFLDATVSPDGNTLAVLEAADHADPLSLYTVNLSFRATSDPTKIVGPVYSQGTNGHTSDTPTLREWSADGTLLTVNSRADDPNNARSRDVNLVSVVTHKAVQQNHLTSAYSLTGVLTSIYDLRQVGPFYTMSLNYHYDQNPGALTTQSITVQNRDGSNKVTLFSASNGSNNVNAIDNNATIYSAQVVQVP